MKDKGLGDNGRVCLVDGTAAPSSSCKCEMPLRNIFQTWKMAIIQVMNCTNWFTHRQFSRSWLHLCCSTSWRHRCWNGCGFQCWLASTDLCRRSQEDVIRNGNSQIFRLFEPLVLIFINAGSHDGILDGSWAVVFRIYCVVLKHLSSWAQRYSTRSSHLKGMKHFLQRRHNVWYDIKIILQTQFIYLCTSLEEHRAEPVSCPGRRGWGSWRGSAGRRSLLESQGCFALASSSSRSISAHPAGKPGSEHPRLRFLQGKRNNVWFVSSSTKIKNKMKTKCDLIYLGWIWPDGDGTTPGMSIHGHSGRWAAWRLPSSTLWPSCTERNHRGLGCRPHAGAGSPRWCPSSPDWRVESLKCHTPVPAELPYQIVQEGSHLYCTPCLAAAVQGQLTSGQVVHNITVFCLHDPFLLELGVFGISQEGQVFLAPLGDAAWQSRHKHPIQLVGVGGAPRREALHKMKYVQAHLQRGPHPKHGTQMAVATAVTIDI